MFELVKSEAILEDGFFHDFRIFFSELLEFIKDVFCKSWLVHLSSFWDGCEKRSIRFYKDAIERDIARSLLDVGGVLVGENS